MQSEESRRKRGDLWGLVAVLVTLAAGVVGAATAQRGGGPPGPPPTPRAAAPLDLTGTWVSVVTEDWRWRMLTPPKGDYTSVPLNEEGRKVADTWEPGNAAADGCKAYGVAGIMRMPGRLRIAWEDDRTLTIETDAGLQTRRLRFDAPPQASGPPTWQGHSVAEWEFVGGRGRGRGGPRPGSLKVVTTNMRAGYLRKNGVPYSENAVVTEYYDRHAAYGTEWFTVTTIVDDPMYLTQEFVTSTHFKQEADDSGWDPRPCE